VAPDGTLVAVANWVSESVSLIETQTHSVIETIAVGDEPQRVAFHPDGDRIYVASLDKPELDVIDATTFEVTDPIDTGLSGGSIATSSTSAMGPSRAAQPRSASTSTPSLARTRCG
jgi:YVTN family beta-propeller protein